METCKHRARIRHRVVECIHPPVVVEDGINVDVLDLDLDSEWEGYDSYTVTWHRGARGYQDIEVSFAIDEPVVQIPPELLTTSGHLSFVVKATGSDDMRLVTASAGARLEIVSSGAYEGGYEPETLTALEEALDRAEHVTSISASVTQTADGADITITDADGTTTAHISNGEDGEDGQDGAPGAPGRDGSDGAPGRDGTDGESAYQIAVDQGFVGTEEEWLASLVGPAGQQGPAGQDGSDGAPGRDGTDGESAYQIAVDQGFVGTESEWLASLVGPAGQDGSDGAPGRDGTDGADGVSCTHSWNGTVLSVTSASGTSSADLVGPAGQDGSDGAPGQDGSDGADGVSCTHSWNGTVLSVTSASGTSSADLVGPAGADGQDGSDGAPGQDGQDGQDGVGIDTITRTDIVTSGTYDVAVLTKMDDTNNLVRTPYTGTAQVADTTTGDLYLASLNRGSTMAAIAGTPHTNAWAGLTAGTGESITAAAPGVVSLVCSPANDAWQISLSYTDGNAETLTSTSPVVAFETYEDDGETGIELTFADGTTRKRPVSEDTGTSYARIVAAQITGTTPVSVVTSPALHFTMSDGTTQDVLFPTLVNGDTQSY